MTNIHPTSIVDKNAEIADDAIIGPWCVIGPKVKIASKVHLRSSVVVDGETTIGEGTEVYPFTTIGVSSQHAKFMNDSGKVIIGKNNKIREHVTIHVGTPVDRNETVIGDDCLLMVNTHIAHDCVIGNGVYMSNLTTLAGHVKVEDRAILGGMCAIHQFCRIGTRAMVGGMTGIGQDIIPYGMITGVRGTLKGLNLIGLKRGGFSVEEIGALRRAYKELFIAEGEETLTQRMERVAEKYKGASLVENVLNFMKGDSKRGISVPKQGEEEDENI